MHQTKFWLRGTLTVALLAEMANRERTFIMIKPDGVQRGIVSKIIERFEQKGFKLVALKFMQASPELLKAHYGDLSAKPFFPVRPLLRALLVATCLRHSRTSHRTLRASSPSTSSVCLRWPCTRLVGAPAALDDYKLTARVLPRAVPRRVHVVGPGRPDGLGGRRRREGWPRPPWCDQAVGVRARLHPWRLLH